MGSVRKNLPQAQKKLKKGVPFLKDARGKKKKMLGPSQEKSREKIQCRLKRDRPKDWKRIKKWQQIPLPKPSKQHNFPGTKKNRLSPLK